MYLVKSNVSRKVSTIARLNLLVNISSSISKYLTLNRMKLPSPYPYLGTAPSIPSLNVNRFNYTAKSILKMKNVILKVVSRCILYAVDWQNSKLSEFVINSSMLLKETYNHPPPKIVLSTQS